MEQLPETTSHQQMRVSIANANHTNVVITAAIKTRKCQGIKIEIHISVSDKQKIIIPFEKYALIPK